MNRRRFLFLGLTGLVFRPSFSLASAGPAIRRPIALGSAGDGRLFILEESGRLLRLEVADPRHPGELATLSDPRFDAGVDLTVGRWRDRRVVAVSYRRQTQSPSTSLSRIAFFDAESGRQETFAVQSSAPLPSFAPLRGSSRGDNDLIAQDRFVRNSYFSGLTFEPSGARLYVSGATDGTIYFAELREGGKGELRSLTTLRGVARLGALIHHPRSSHLFVSDPSDGIVYRVDTGSGAYEPIARKLGAPTALLLLPERSELLIAEGLNGRIWKLRLEDGAKPVDIAPEAKLRQPSGLALLPSGHLCVAEAWNNRLSFLDLDGKVVARFPAVP